MEPAARMEGVLEKSRSGLVLGRDKVHCRLQEFHFSYSKQSSASLPAARRRQSLPAAETSVPLAAILSVKALSGKKAAQWPSLTRRWLLPSLASRSEPLACWRGWVNTTPGNIKTALAGTCHHFDAKHAQRYLASFARRFNHRYQRHTMSERLMSATLQIKPRPYQAIIAG